MPRAGGAHTTTTLLLTLLPDVERAASHSIATRQQRLLDIDDDALCFSCASSSFPRPASADHRLSFDARFMACHRPAPCFVPGALKMLASFRYGMKRWRDSD